jgi:hypothetical protein
MKLIAQLQPTADGTISNYITKAQKVTAAAASAAAVCDNDSSQMNLDALVAPAAGDNAEGALSLAGEF